VRGRVAAIDIGSNSVRLLVAESGVFFEPVYRDRRVTRLFGGMRDGMLNDESVGRTALAVEELIARARGHGADRIEAFGTSALREGINGGLIADCAAHAHVPLHVLSGEEEARIAYAGASSSGREGLIDIGGGSTEWAVGADGVVIAAGSAPVGAVRLGEVLAQGTVRGPIEFAKQAMAAVHASVASHEADRWIGVGGSITTLAAMIKQLETYSDEMVDGVLIAYDQAKAMYDLLVFLPPPLRAEMKGLEKSRADIIHFGIAILLAFFEMTGVKEIRAAVADNLAGYLKLYMKDR